MGVLIRPGVGQFILWMRINRTQWMMNVFTGMAQPLIMQVIFGAFVEEGAHTRLLIGNVVFGLMLVSMRKTCLTLNMDREYHQRSLTATTLVSRNAYLTAALFDAATMSLLPLTLLLVGPLIFERVSMPVSPFFLVSFALSAAMYYGLAVCFASLKVDVSTMVLLMNLVNMAVLAFCPLLYPLQSVPEIARDVVGLLPFSLSAELMEAAWVGSSAPAWQLPALAIWAAFFLAVGWRSFPWTDRQ